MLTNEIVAFANGNVDFYEAAVQYFSDKANMTSEKGALLHKSFIAEVEKKAGVSREGLDAIAWANHPSVKWASMAILDSVIAAIIPTTILPQFSLFADFKAINYGDTIKFVVKPNTMYTVTEGSNGERKVLRQRKFAKEIFVAPITHMITVYENWLNVLADKTMFGEFAQWVIVSMEQKMFSDAILALNAGLAEISDPDLYVNGAYDIKTLVKMCEKVQALNGGAKPVIAGCATALLNVVPDSVSGYRMNIDAKNAGIELVKSVLGFDVMVLDNAMGMDGDLALAPDMIYVVSPAQDKLLKGGITTTLQNTSDYFDNADITKDFTYRRAWAFEFAGSAKAGVYVVQD